MTQVAERSNFAIFQRAPVGSAVRIAGQFGQSAGGAARQFTTTDGGSITIMPEAQDNLSAVTGFVEVVGTKSADSKLQATAVLPLPGDVDVNLWDEYVKMIHTPQLRQPLPARGLLSLSQ